MSTEQVASPSALGISLHSVERQEHGAPQIEVHLWRNEYPADDENSFKPLRLPEQATMTVHGPLIGLVKRARCKFQLEYRPGIYAFPVGSGAPPQVEIQPDTTGTLTVELGSRNEKEGLLILSYSLDFHKPLIIRQVIHLLGQVQQLFDDPRLAILKGLTPFVPPWLRELGGRTLSQADNAALILLNRITANASGEIEPTLAFNFSGTIRLLEEVERPFERITLPSSVLPIPFASMDRLISKRPFTSATLSGAPNDPRGLLRALFDSLAHVEGEIDAELAPPNLLLRTTSGDGAKLAGRLRLPGGLSARGHLRAAIDHCRLKIEEAQVRLSEQAHQDALAMEVRGEMGVDLDTPELTVLQRLSIVVENNITVGSSWSSMLAELSAEHPLTRQSALIPLQIRDLSLGGGFAFSYDGHRPTWRPTSVLTAKAKLVSPASFIVREAQGKWTGQIDGDLDLNVLRLGAGEWQAGIRCQALLNNHIATIISGLPELDIHGGEMLTDWEARLSFELRPMFRFSPSQAMRIDLSGSQFSLVLDRLVKELGRMRIMLPAGTIFSGQWQQGVISSTGVEDCSLRLQWDLRNEPCLLQNGERVISLIPENLRQGTTNLQFDNSGKISFSADSEGMKHVRYFNALLNPAGDLKNILDLLQSADVLAPLLEALSVVSSDAASLAHDLRLLLRGGLQIFRREKILQPGDLIPLNKLARVLSLLLRGNDSLASRLEPLLSKIISADEFPLVGLKKLLQQELAEFEIDYEINAIINWLKLVLSPSEIITRPPTQTRPPLVLDPRFEQLRQGLPSAGEIYAWTIREKIEEHDANKLAEISPQLTLKQLEFFLAQVRAPLPPNVLRRLRYVTEVKRRVEAIEQEYGGLEYLFQPYVIALFLGEAAGPLSGINCSPIHVDGAWPPPCALGPQDVAILMQAGLARPAHGLRAQLNNRLLLELLKQMPPEFTQAVFIELGNQSPRALSGILYAFLDQDQSQMDQPLDLVALLSDKLGLQIPRQNDFMAGGSRARESYLEALCEIADNIIDNAEPYLARKQHLQVVRQPAPPTLIIKTPVDKLVHKVQESIAKADEIGGQCNFITAAKRGGGPQQRARKAYAHAFDQCKLLLTKEPLAFSLYWFKEFWQRNEEALKVLSVVRNWQQEIDEVRPWFKVQTGRDDFADEQELTGAVIDALYWEEKDKNTLRADPLVRLLIDPPLGKYNFTIVSCMGVITDGADGQELVDAYQRLQEQRGIKIIRAHTGTARSLEYNARQIIAAIRACTTPWGIIGYSQGCANALRAESMLYGGTPDEQRLLDGLVCRNFLFSSANGSGHGTSGTLKFRRALILGERYLKHYQAIYSREAIQTALRLVKTLLDSQIFVHVLGGAHSLSFERARALHRDGQFLTPVPTSHTRGITTRRCLPEALEFLYYLLSAVTDDQAQDTQVLASDAIGQSTHVQNVYTETLARYDMHSMIQHTHHWAPLTREIEIVKTARDRELAIYESPKDRLVCPWLDVNARFGRIEGTV